MNIYRQSKKESLRRTIELLGFEYRIEPRLKLELEENLIQYERIYGCDKWFLQMIKYYKNNTDKNG